MLNRGKCAVVACVLSLGLAGRVVAQSTFKYTGCTDVTSANFTVTPVLNKAKDPTLDEPIRFAIAKSGAIYVAERGGVIKVIKTDGAVARVGKIDAYPSTSPMVVTNWGGNKNNELGLVGLALDPAFETNHYIYVNYQAKTTDVTNISRFTLVNDALDMTSEKVILSFPIQKNYCCHTGGDMRFDAKGDLWITSGNNTRNPITENDVSYVDESTPDADDQGHAANTNDLRGKILRIHPTPAGGYTVPAGNLKDAYASMWTADELAKVKPEIYTMGHRNPYTLSVDDVQGLLAWGEVGPDAGWDTEEYNIVNKPGFMGWPYFAGAVGNAHYAFKLNKDPNAPMNTSKNNTGVQKLPPAQGASIGYRQSAAISGPIYRWTVGQTSAKKLPAHFDGKWFISDFNQNFISVVTLDATGTKPQGAAVKFYTGMTRPLQVSVGPDGVLYTLEYATGYKFAANGGTISPAADNSTKISRFDYTGAPCAATTSLKDRLMARSYAGKTELLNLAQAGNNFVTLPSGSKGVRLYDLQGKLAWQSANAGEDRVAVPASLAHGLYRAKFEF